jgi:hypothetical protein
LRKEKIDEVEKRLLLREEVKYDMPRASKEKTEAEVFKKMWEKKNIE